MLQEDGAHLPYGFAALGTGVPVVGAQGTWHRGQVASDLVLVAAHQPHLCTKASHPLGPPAPGIPAEGQGSFGHMRVWTGTCEGSGECFPVGREP